MHSRIEDREAVGGTDCLREAAICLYVGPYGARDLTACGVNKNPSCVIIGEG